MKTSDATPCLRFLRSDSEEETLRLGARLGEVLRPGDILCLQGELGTGKTVLVRGLARSRGYRGPVTSPSFTIIQLYPEASVCHVDAYRLDGAGDLLDAGIEEYTDDWLCAVEWADRVRGALPADALLVSLGYGESDNERMVRIEAEGDWDGRLAGLPGEPDDG
ncbi:MAG: tRNA (adenosine(37)-N6)-threonylcarbamoyltransferase complex ATPase subunit type 1 TsaE [Actinomycetota bacterium]